MATPLVLFLERPMTPDESYTASFRHFQAMFRSSRGDVTRTQLPSCLHESAYGDFVTMGSVITGALLAMLAHHGDDVDWSGISLEGLRIYVKTRMPPAVQHLFDEIIITQGAITGTALAASELVMMRLLEWERGDYNKFERWTSALNKAARVLQGKMKTPLDRPELAEVKRQGVEQIRPVLAGLRDWHRNLRTKPSEDQIVNAFAEQVRTLDLPFLSHPDNLTHWLEFCRTEPLSFLNLSAEVLFDSFVGFVSKHESEYARKKISSTSSN